MLNKKLLLNSFTFLKESLAILVGIFITGFGLEGFLIPNGFIDGGITGISLLISFLTPLSLPLLLFVINLPFAFLAYKHIGKIFAIKTFLAIMGLSLCLLLVDFPVITSDKLLISIFGGFLIGAGIGFSLRGGSVLDGTEILSVYLNRKTRFSIGEIIFFINVLIFGFATVFLGIEIALYSILIYLVAYKTIDFISHGFEEYTGITIISEKNSEIRKKLVQDLGKGVTIYKGKKGFTIEKDINILFTVVNRLEVNKVKKAIAHIDPNALIIEEKISEIYGGFIRKRKPVITK